MTSAKPSNGRTIAQYVSSAARRELPRHVEDAGRLCLADWIGVAIGARDEAAARIVHEIGSKWSGAGGSTVLLGGTAAAPVAALCNGTLAHCLDFDDTYVKAVTHMSAPLWAATLALGEEIGASEKDMLAAFVTGFETAARVGYGLGEAVTARGWHGTGVFGRIGAAAAGAVLLGLDEDLTLHALGLAATQTSGLTASFGTMAKPFHAGKAAMDGVTSAQLAAGGFKAATDLFEPRSGLDSALIQDGSLAISPADFSGWEILQNSFKPYAACHLAHPAVDAARAIRARGVALDGIRSIRAEVAELAHQITGAKSGAPTTPLEAKFDLKYCVALALHGRSLSAADFPQPLDAPSEIVATARKVAVVPSAARGYTAAAITVELERGDTLSADIPVAKGHPGNPVTWDDMRAKFEGLIAPRLGEEKANALFAELRTFGNGNALAMIRALAA